MFVCLFVCLLVCGIGEGEVECCGEERTGGGAPTVGEGKGEKKYEG